MSQTVEKKLVGSFVFKGYLNVWLSGNGIMQGCDPGDAATESSKWGITNEKRLLEIKKTYINILTFESGDCYTANFAEKDAKFAPVC